MKKTLLICTTGLLSFYLSAAKAQTDTTRYDLGRVQISKNSTQAITIKAADLERMPFSNLSEAINVWLYGVYGSTATYVPVVDGVTMSNINTLSIYDIDEITLVQNAIASINGASPQQLLLLIKTKRNHSGKKYGVEAAGQTNVIALHTSPAPANANYTVSSALQFYNQYYLSGYVNTGKIHAGVSADFQRDGVPVEKVKPTGNNGSTYNSGQTASINRYRFNGYLDADLGKSTLSINTGYVPQTGNNNFETITSNAYEVGQDKLKDNIYYANASLKSTFSGFQNTLTGSYEHYKATNNQNGIGESYNGYGYVPFQYNGNIGLGASNYVFKDNLSHKFKTGNWEFEPNVNLMYRDYKVENANSQNESIAGPYSYLDTTINTSENHNEKATTLTPSLSINYHNVIIIQGGFEYILSNSITNREANSDSLQYTYYTYNNKAKKLYPFLSATWNAAGINKDKDPFMWSFSGSYAQSAAYELDNSYMMPFYIYSVYANDLQTISTNPVNGNNLFTTAKQWQLGTTMSFSRNKVAFSYNYSSNQLNTAITETYYSYQPSYNYNYISKLTIHRLGFDINWKKTEQFAWKTNLNTSFIKAVSTYQIQSNQVQTDQNTHFVTGGLTNRLDSKRTFAGMDILYFFQAQHFHAFNLQNLYYGKRFKVSGNKTLEVFANMRSMIEDRSPTLLDYRKYYGLGFKLGL